MQTAGKIAIAASTIIFCSLLIFQLAPTDSSNAVYDKGIGHFKHQRSIPERYCQGEKCWKELKNRDFPLCLINWQLVTNPDSSDKYVDKDIIGTIKNNSKEEFSEAKIEFTVYDEDGAQIAIVFSSVYNFKPGGIWKFEIPVTLDVEKAELKGLYLPAKEFKGLPKQ